MVRRSIITRRTFGMVSERSERGIEISSQNVKLRNGEISGFFIWLSVCFTKLAHSDHQRQSDTFTARMVESKPTNSKRSQSILHSQFHSDSSSLPNICQLSQLHSPRHQFLHARLTQPSSNPIPVHTLLVKAINPIKISPMALSTIQTESKIKPLSFLGINPGLPSVRMRHHN